MALPVLAAPILGRLYSPSDYGALAVFLMISTVLGSMSTLQLNLGIVADASDRQADLLLRVAILASLTLSVCTAPLAIWLLSTPAIAGFWFLGLPIAICLGGVSASVNSLANRQEAYSALSNIQIASAVSIVGTSIAAGIAGLGFHGLFMGYFAGQVTVFVLSIVLLRARLKLFRQKLTVPRVLQAVRRNRNYLTWSLPAAFFDRLNREGPTYAFALMGLTSQLGEYTRSRQLLILPSTIVGGAIGNVFFQRASRDMATDGTAIKIWRRTFFLLCVLGVPGAIILAALAPVLFEILLGAQWRGAGDVARILTPMLLASFICAPLSRIYYIAGRQKEDFFLMLFTTLLILFIGIAALQLSWGFEAALTSFTGLYTLIYAIYIIRSYQLAKAPNRKIKTALNNHASQ